MMDLLEKFPKYKLRDLNLFLLNYINILIPLIKLNISK